MGSNAYISININQLKHTQAEQTESLPISQVFCPMS